MEIDFKAAREKCGLTLKRASDVAGYSVATINALELDRRGSDRLKEKLMEVYGIKKVGEQHFQQIAPSIHEIHPPYGREKVIAKLRSQVQNLQEQLAAMAATINELES